VLPAGVWLVEQGAAYEQYSNGLRIETTYATTGEPRAFRTLTEDGALEPGTQTKPIGLLFHTSESDVWPLTEANNEKLRDSSQRLLKYVQRNRLYHYLIDRFGRAYRVVDEGAKANHAGFGVWMNEGKVYLNLNHAFLGVSFETRWEGGKALPITQAQLETGRNLSDFLRQRYQIRPEMCVTHGLTSVNPKKRLIGHHMDWARGFPFEAFGLPDQYQRAAPSVTLFGFGYDEDFLKVMDKPWPGVAEAFRRLEGEALVSGKSLEEVRLERQLLFDRWWALQSQGESVAGAGQQAASQSQSSGG
jgi:N-acetyl-anhydromuramyl-L-alanine amidase AmpD